MKLRTVARWETRGKDWLELELRMTPSYQDPADLSGMTFYAYSGNGCGGFLPKFETDGEAIAYMERNAVATLRSDRPSLRRIA